MECPWFRTIVLNRKSRTTTKRIGLKRLTEIAVLTPFTNTENSKQEPGNLNAELVVHVSDAALVRALKDLETGSIPFSRRGDIPSTGVA